MSAADRYLRTPSNRLVGGRGYVSLFTFGVLFPLTVLILAAIVVGGTMGVLLGLLTAALFVGWVGLMWWALLSGGRDLQSATDAWFRGDDAPAYAAAHRALRLVFRADVRCKAFHLLGLCAERQGDFEAALDLFQRAHQALPAMAAPVRKRYVELLLGGHRALGLLALGRGAEAQQLLAGLSQLFARAGQTGVLDVLTDDATWGLGPISMNETLMKLENGRDPRALISFCWAIVHLRNHNPGEALRLLDFERPVLDRYLQPHELATAQLIHQRCRGEQQAAQTDWARRLVG